MLHLARKCGYEERHSRHVARLALDLFDSARALGLHALSPDLRELLHYAGLLHDIGIFISFSRHNVHSHYLIRNTELLGFTAREVELLAALAYFHRKRPTRKTPFYTELDDDMRAEVRPLSLFLLLAERMDKSHRQIIRAARFVQGDDGLLLRVNAADDCPIEMEQLRHSLKNIRKVFATREIALECRREESRPN